jgi:hypothetical protein
MVDERCLQVSARLLPRMGIGGARETQEIHDLLQDFHINSYPKHFRAAQPIPQQVSV